MPDVKKGGKTVQTFPYTKAGEEQAETFAKKVGGKMKSKPPKKGRRK